MDKKYILLSCSLVIITIGIWSYHRSMMRNDYMNNILTLKHIVKKISAYYENNKVNEIASIEEYYAHGIISEKEYGIVNKLNVEYNSSALKDGAPILKYKWSSDTEVVFYLSGTMHIDKKETDASKKK